MDWVPPTAALYVGLIAVPSLLAIIGFFCAVAGSGKLRSAAAVWSIVVGMVFVANSFVLMNSFH